MKQKNISYKKEKPTGTIKVKEYCYEEGTMKENILKISQGDYILLNNMRICVIEYDEEREELYAEILSKTLSNEGCALYFNKEDIYNIKLISCEEIVERMRYGYPNDIRNEIYNVEIKITPDSPWYKDYYKFENELQDLMMMRGANSEIIHDREYGYNI